MLCVGTLYFPPPLARATPASKCKNEGRLHLPITKNMLMKCVKKRAHGIMPILTYPVVKSWVYIIVIPLILALQRLPRVVRTKIILQNDARGFLELLDKAIDGLN
jgi:hypothetical protein